MPVIRPMTDLRKKGSILADISNNQPLFLTENGYGKYVILNLTDYHALLTDEKQPPNTDPPASPSHFKTTEQWLEEERLRNDVLIPKTTRP